MTLSILGPADLSALKACSPNVFSSPSQGFLKLKFDISSKGNLGLNGLGGILRNERGKVVKIYAASCDNSSNNVVDFLVLEE